MAEVNAGREGEQPVARVRGGATPRWVKVLGAIGIALIVAFVILHLTGHGFGGHHGFGDPGR